MTALRFVLFSILPVIGLAYCFWKTQLDWKRDGFGFRVIWGLVASISAFISVALLLTAKVLSDL